MIRNRIKVLSIATLVLPLLAIVVFTNKPVKAVSSLVDDPATVYKAKCAMCHSPKAEKFFDASKADDALASVVMKGSPTSKPPMPGYEAKGMKAEEATALVSLMKSLKQ